MTVMQQIAIDPNAPHRRIVFDAIDDRDDRAARFAERTGWTLRAADDPSVIPLTGRPPAAESTTQAGH
jgi:hypothetical protein